MKTVRAVPIREKTWARIQLARAVLAVLFPLPSYRMHSAQLACPDIPLVFEGSALGRFSDHGYGRFRWPLFSDSLRRHLQRICCATCFEKVPTRQRRK